MCPCAPAVYVHCHSTPTSHTYVTLVHHMVHNALRWCTMYSSTGEVVHNVALTFTQPVLLTVYWYVIVFQKRAIYSTCKFITLQSVCQENSCFLW